MDTPQISPGKKPQVDIIDIRSSTHDTSILKELKAALSCKASSLPCLLLWDEKGLQHFEAITYAEDYYLTNCEIDLLQQHSYEIAQQIAPNSVILELGSGCLRKIKILLDALEALHKSVDYFALDLSRSELERALIDICPDSFEYVRCHGLLGTYDDGNKWLHSKELTQRPMCILSLGSTIGSASRSEAARFLRGFTDAIKSTPDISIIFVVGVDGCKDGPAVWKAYNDPEGRNSRFILNVLHHANTLLGHDAFNPEDWVVHGEWNETLGRQEQYLIPDRNLCIDGVEINKEQKVFVVSSHKYDTRERSELWERAGLKLVSCWKTEPHNYSLNVLSVAKDTSL